MSEINEKSLMLINLNSSSIELDGNRAVECSKRFDRATCFKGNPCMHLCVTQECQKAAIVCNDLSCECKLSHKGSILCRLADPREIVKKLERKRMSNPGVNGYLNKIFQEFTDWISEFEKQLESKVHKMGLNDQEGAFLDLTYKGKLEDLTGQMMSAVIKELDKEEQHIETQAEKLKEIMQENWEKVVDPVKEQIKSLEIAIDEFSFLLKNEESFVDSKIVTTKDERKTLLSFFPKAKKPVGSKLLFRASEHNFSTAKFNEICFKKENTVVIIKTNFDKVIGGFTPLELLGHALNSGAYGEDISKESFIFSLTNKDKFNIKNGNTDQVYHSKKYGPTFGSGHDIYIADCANANTSSYALIGASYENPKYTCGNAASLKLFSGGENKKFSTLEWEVFQLSFKE